VPPTILEVNAGVLRMINIEGVEYLTAAEAAGMLGVKVTTLYSYASRGRIQSYRRGIKRERFYRRDDIEALLKMRPADGMPDDGESSPNRWTSPS
jgi:excisionase family DNA binding protein